MVSTRLASRAPSPIATALSVVLIFCLGSCSSSVSTTDVRAEDSKDTDAEVDPDLVVPDGTPDEIRAFAKKLRNRPQKKFASRQAFVDNAIKTQRAFIAAGDKLLSQKTEDKVAVEAVQMKLAAMFVLAANEVGDSAKEALAAVTKLKSDEREAVAKAAEQFWLPIRIVNTSTMSSDERKALIDEVVTLVGTSKFSRESVGAANQLGEVLTATNHSDEAIQLYEQLAKISAESTDPKFRQNADRFAAIARRMRLPGNFMEVEGRLLDGKVFDWASYRGKVVLVDFWATWCGPCVAELPNVKENYKKYHGKGFDVVGISLDNARAPLEAFIAKEELPWAQLYDEESQRGNGWKHPMAAKYNIDGIPAAFLVDKEGKVVSMAARAEDLSALLEKLLGPAE